MKVKGGIQAKKRGFRLNVRRAAAASRAGKALQRSFEKQRRGAQ